MSNRGRSTAAGVHGLLECLERRQLMTFAMSDPSFGRGGRVTIPDADKLLSNGGTYLQVTPIADGRLVAASNAGVAYLRGDGNVDPKRGNGVGFKSFSSSIVAADVAVDPKTGRVAVLRFVGGDSTKVALDLYDAKGRLAASRDLPDGGVKVAFQPGGDVFVVNERTIPASVPNGITDGDHYADIRRFDSQLNVVHTGYGSGGVGTIGYASDVHGVSEGDGAYVSGLYVDAAGRAYVAAILNDATPGAPTDYSESVYRLTATGQNDTAYGTSGVAELYHYAAATANATVVDPTFLDPTDRILDADGRFYVLERIRSSFSDRPEETRYQLLRIGTDGRARDTADAGNGVRVGDALFDPGSLAVAGDGSVYVGLATNETRHFLAAHLESDPAFSKFGNVAFGTLPVEAADLAVTADGRLLRTGYPYQSWGSDGRAFTIYATRGTSESVAPTLGSAAFTVTSDGTLVVNGTAKNDTIEIRRRTSDVLVIINRKEHRVPRNSIHALVVNAGAGNDRVTVGVSTPVGYIDAGKGDDVVIAGGTLVGGSGNDRLEGTDITNDIQYGQDGNDTLIGGDYSDALYGGAGNDQIYSGPAAEGDAGPDYINAGRGVDTIHRGGGDVLDKDSSDKDLFY